MKDTLTDEQVASYRDNGFLVIEGFLDASELEEWRRCTDEAVAARVEQGSGKDGGAHALHNQLDPEGYYARVFTQALRLAEVHDGMRGLMHDERLGRLAGTLAGVDGIRIWHDQALIKPPFGNPTAWHLDNPYWSFSSPNSISLWMALDDATLSNGCMWYLPGTQRTAHYETVGIGHNIADLFRHYPDWRSIEPVACPCSAGSAVFHNGLTAHGAGANMTNRPRRAMTCAYMPDGSTFNGTKNILTDAEVERLSIGDPLTDDVHNPRIWRRSAA